MIINIKLSTARELKKALAATGGHLDERRSYQNRDAKADDLIEVDLSDLTTEDYGVVAKILAVNKERCARTIKRVYDGLNDPENKPITALNLFPQIARAYFSRLKYPFLYSLDGEQRGAAYVPSSASYNPPDRNSGSFATLTLHYNEGEFLRNISITISKNTIGQTMAEILKEKALVSPEAELIADYDKIMNRFERFRKMDGEQFWVRGIAREVSDGYWWDNDEVNMTQQGRPTKAVVDYQGWVESRERRNRRENSVAFIASDLYDTEGTRRVPVPTHPVIPLFSLAHHTLVWANVVNMRQYKYETDLLTKLVLPKTHSRLIGALVSNLEVLQQEAEADGKSRTIKAKASSNVILAKGPAGTGKTLSAEVYAEEIQRPLYEVQSGQIGVEPEEIESNLKFILNRSVRLRMPLLINEADVFIQERGRDLKQNAVVSVFLRLLEYHNGLVFMTSNRADDIDDAILSRCIAQIRFDIPVEADKVRLWKIMLAEFNVHLSLGDQERAARVFPEVAGRDIQNLIRLTSRVCKACNEQFTLEALMENAIFKDIKVLPKGAK